MLGTADSRNLPPCLKREIERECRRLWQLIEMFAEVDIEQRQAAENTAPDVQLSQLLGIGLTIASVLTNEVFFSDFQNRREVAANLGLASSPWRQWRSQPRSRHPEIEQPACAANRRRACLAVVAPPA
ncbi:hypothetical protein [Mesorhizobium sp. M0187]|uniref:hypothetical protein n=1 Tax=Mesorhizobium sp. M0187 TaxID=2956908 RepID=UPI003335BF2F